MQETLGFLISDCDWLIITKDRIVYLTHCISDWLVVTKDSIPYCISDWLVMTKDSIPYIQHFWLVDNNQRQWTLHFACFDWLITKKDHISHTSHFWLVDNNQVAYLATSSEAWPLLSSPNIVYIAKSVVAVASSTGCKHCKQKPESHYLQAVMWSKSMIFASSTPPPPPQKKKKKKKISDEKPSL